MQRMISLARYKSLAVVGTGLLCAFIFCNAVLLIAFGKDPSMFDDPDRQLAWQQLERMGERVAGVEQQLRHDGPDVPQHYGLILGQSTTLRGIDPDILEQAVRPSHPWILLNGFGSSFVKLHYYAQTLLASKLHPDTIILGLHSTMIAGQDRDKLKTDQPDAGPTATEKDRPLRHLFSKPNWVHTQRMNISHHTHMALFELRLAIHTRLGSGAVGLFTPSHKPWRPSSRDELPDRRDPKFLRRQVKGWRDFGWYEPGSYVTGNQHADAFRDLIAGLDALGPKRIIIVILPISSDLRGWLPPEAQQAFEQLIDEVSVGRPVHVIDMRDAMPDDAFADYAHLNPAGRTAFSGLLSDRLNAMNTPE